MYTKDDTTTTPKAVKSKADYMALAESALMQSEWQNDRQLFEGEQNSLKRASIYAQLAIAAPEASAPDDYLSVCNQRDRLVTAASKVYDALISAEWASPEHAEEIFNDLIILYSDVLRGAILFAKQTAEPENAE